MERIPAMPPVDRFTDREHAPVQIGVLCDLHQDKVLARPCRQDHAWVGVLAAEMLANGSYGWFPTRS